MNLEWGVIWERRDEFLSGAMVTILLTVTTMLVAIPGGIVLMLMRNSRVWGFPAFASAFVTFFLNVPMILLVYWCYYVLPQLVNLRVPAFTMGLIALALGISAINAETFRAGVNSIRKGQMEAGLTLGMTRWQVMRRVVLPQAVYRVIPAFASTWVSLFKATSLVSIITVGELAYVSFQIRSQTFRILEVLTAMAAIYWIMGYPQAKLVDWLYRKCEVRE